MLKSALFCFFKMKVVAFIMDYQPVDRIIDHLKLTSVTEKPPPPQMAFQEVLMAAALVEYFPWQSSFPEERSG